MTKDHKLSAIFDTCPACGFSRERIEDTRLTCKQAKGMTGKKKLHILSEDGEELNPRRAK